MLRSELRCVAFNATSRFGDATSEEGCIGEIRGISIVLHCALFPTSMGWDCWTVEGDPNGDPPWLDIVYPTLLSMCLVRSRHREKRLVCVLLREYLAG